MTTAIQREIVLSEQHETATESRFEIIGKPGAPVIAVLGGISASRHVAASTLNNVAGWWENTVGDGKAIETSRFRVIGIDWVTEVETGITVSTHDQADALARALDRIGVQCLHAIVGASYGGMVALAFAERYPERTGRVVSIAAAHESHPHTTALRVLQRQVVELGRDSGFELDALRVARGIAIAGYGTQDEFGAQFPSVIDAAARCESIQSHLASAAQGFVTSCSPEKYLALSRSLDIHKVDASKIRTPVTLIAVREDTVVPLSQVRELAKALGGPVRVVEVRSTSGHDAFLNDPGVIGSAVADAISKAVAFVPERNVGDTRLAKPSATLAVRAGIATDLHHGAVVAPLHLSSTFAFNGFGKKGRYDYTRSGNPTRDQLGDALANLEGGSTTVVTSTGMSAVSLVLQLVKPGDLILAAHDCYGGTHRILRSLAERGHFTVQFADLTCDNAVALVESRKPQLLWIETPSNPLLRITDLRKVIAAGHRAGAVVAVDNTFLSPALQRPIEFGADLVIHSTTKYLNGHSDVVGGAVIAADGALGEELTWWANCLGITGAPFDSFLTLRGVRTLAARMRVHLENAATISELLEAHPAVDRVFYPGLASHPAHHLAASQQDGFGAMVSFELRGGIESAERLVNHLKCFTLAESLGGVESLIAHPATMTHSSMDAKAREAAGISDTLLRLSVGIEDGDDLESDLRQALETV